MDNFLKNKFSMEELGTDVKTEVLAGLTTFMTMAYVVIVHPSIMEGAGMPVEAMTVVTALVTGVFTIIMGLYTNLPFALAPAMGSNAFMAYTLVAAGVVNWQQGLGMVFISGIAFILLTVLGLRKIIVDMVPSSIKFSIGAAVGLFIAQLGFSNAGFLDFDAGLLALGDITETGTILSIIGLFILMSLMVLDIKGGLFIGIIVTSLIGIPMGVTPLPDSLVSLPPSISPIAGELDVLGALRFSFIPLMFVFFSGDFFSTMGTLLGVANQADMLDEDGNLPEIEKPFLVDGLATTVGAFLGTTTVTTYIESASGVEEGGRSGLTAIVTGLSFLLVIFFTPIVQVIPEEATAPALILIGLLMMPAIKKINFDDFTESLPAFITVMFTAYTFNLANGISLGIITYVFVKLVAGRKEEIPLGLYFLCIPLLYYFYTL